MCSKSCIYKDEIDGKIKTVNINSIMCPKKYTKGPSVLNKTKLIKNIIKPFLKNEISQITGKKYLNDEFLQINEWEKENFQIKKMSNGERMGIKNLYSITKDKNLLNNEMKKIENSIFVIFDDNISGGATLADICLQLRSIGINNTIPITFGQMNEKWTLGRIPLIIPSNNKGGKWNF